MINHSHLRLFQFCDSQFPTGAFSHSFGLETYIQRQTVHDATSFREWLELFLNEQLTYSDGLAMRLVYNALNNGDTEKVLHLDQLIYVQSLPRETRVGTKQMGTRMVKLAIELYDSPWINWYHQQMKDKRAKLHPAICFTMLGHYLGVDIETIIDYYLYQNVSSLTQNAVRNSLRSNNRTTSCDGDDSTYRTDTTTHSHIKRRRFRFNSSWLRTESNGA